MAEVIKLRFKKPVAATEESRLFKFSILSPQITSSKVASIEHGDIVVQFQKTIVSQYTAVQINELINEAKENTMITMIIVKEHFYDKLLQPLVKVRKIKR